MKKNIFVLIVFVPLYFFAQSINKDTTFLKEVVVVGKYNSNKVSKLAKVSSSVDEYLQSSKSISLIKRGAYAWEPLLNNMLSERSVITIDGMRVFGACTDKMDPVTSYVETSNLDEIEIFSGQEGSSCGATVAGGVNLKCKSSNFSKENKSVSTLQTGYESNNNHKFYLSSNRFTSDSFVSNVSLSYRKADNYKTGGIGEVVDYSQFEKYNGAVNLGVKISDKSHLKGNFIFDRAINVGFPALPMDISLAQTFISSLGYTYYSDLAWLRSLETKLYHNTITHIMDDTKRKEGDKLPIHMDMPGWSDTYGGYSEGKLSFGRLTSKLKFSGYHNLRTAEMTMYYNSGVKMFMYTWPKVSKEEVAIHINNEYCLTQEQKLKLNVAFSRHKNSVNSEKALNLNRTFYPNIKKERVCYLPSLNISYTNALENISFNVGLGRGYRAPSVSEGYGFYLFNSFDGFDYIGNPNLKCEISNEMNFKTVYKKKKVKLKINANVFYIQNYIFGKMFRSGQFQMTPISPKNGVKKYVSLDNAMQMSLAFGFDYKLMENWSIKNSLGYSYGKDYKNRPLPFIQPFTYKSEVCFNGSGFWSVFSVNGDTEQVRFSKAYGEDNTPAYTLIDVFMGYKIPDTNFDIELGVENLFDRCYSTYSDWKNFPRMGRNMHLGMSFNF